MSARGVVLGDRLGSPRRCVVLKLATRGVCRCHPGPAAHRPRKSGGVMGSWNSGNLRLGAARLHPLTGQGTKHLRAALLHSKGPVMNLRIIPGVAFEHLCGGPPTDI